MTKRKFKTGDNVTIHSTDFPAIEGVRGIIRNIWEGKPYPYEVEVPDQDGSPFLCLEHELKHVTQLAPQTRAILDHLKNIGTISGVEAAALYRARALPKRIMEIREAGYPVKAEWKKDRTQQRYKRYFLEDRAA